MATKYDHATVNCTKDTKEAIKYLAKFCNMTQRDLLKYLLMNKGVIKSNGANNIFDHWDDDHTAKFLKYLDSIEKFN